MHPNRTASETVVLHEKKKKEAKPSLTSIKMIYSTPIYF